MTGDELRALDFDVHRAVTGVRPRMVRGRGSTNDVEIHDDNPCYSDGVWWEEELRAVAANYPRYATDITAAWLVVERMGTLGYTARIEWKGAGRGYEFTAEVSFSKFATDGHGVGTAPEAICRAALMALRGVAQGV